MYVFWPALWVPIILTFGCVVADFSGNNPAKKTPRTKTFYQDTFPIKQQIFSQGHTGEPGSANFEQGEWGKLDILVVVDNSLSMVEEQENLASKLTPLISHVEKADWRIAVTTTDPAYGCINALVDKGEDNASAFSGAVLSAGTNGSGIERGFSQAVSALKADCLAAPWIRPDSTLAVLIVSDEDNCHIDENRGYDESSAGCTAEGGGQSSYLSSYIESIRDLGQNARVYGLTWQPGTICDGALQQADRYLEAIRASGTEQVSGSICEDDYTTTLTAISKDVAQILKYEFELEHRPDDDTLAITVDGQVWTHFILDDRIVKFTQPPPFGSNIDVAYKYGKFGELNTDFVLEGQVAPEGILSVAVDGADSTNFDASESFQKVIFRSPPAERARISIQYKEFTDLNKVFRIGNDVSQRSVRVKVDDKSVRGWRFEEDEGAVIFDLAPPEGAQIDVTYTSK